MLPLIDLARTWLSTSGSTARKTRTAALLAHLAQAGSSLYEGPVQHTLPRNFDDNGYMTGYTVPANLADADKVVTHLDTKYQELRDEAGRQWGHPTALLMHKKAQGKITTKESSLMTELAGLVAPAPLTTPESPQAFIARITNFMKMVEAGRQFAQRPDAPAAVKQAITNLGDVTAEQLRQQHLPAVYSRYLADVSERLQAVQEAQLSVETFITGMLAGRERCYGCGGNNLELSYHPHPPELLGEIDAAATLFSSGALSIAERDSLATQRDALNALVVEVEQYRTERNNRRDIATVYVRLAQIEKLEEAFQARMQEVADWQPKVQSTPNYLVTGKMGYYVSCFDSKLCCGFDKVIAALQTLRDDMVTGLAILQTNPNIVPEVISDMRSKVARCTGEEYITSFQAAAESAEKMKRGKRAACQQRAGYAQVDENAIRQAWAANGGFNPAIFSGMGPGGTGGYASAPAAAPGGYGLPPRQGSDAPPPPPPAATVPAGDIVHLLQKALGIAEGADYAATRKAYRQFTRKNHPDKLDQARGQFVSDALFVAAKAKATNHFQAVSGVWGIAGASDDAFAAALRDGFAAGTSEGVEGVLREMAEGH